MFKTGLTFFFLNKQIRELLHVKKSSTNTAYGLYAFDEHGVDNICVYINVQVPQENTENRCSMEAVFRLKNFRIFFDILWSIPDGKNRKLARTSWPRDLENKAVIDVYIFHYFVFLF